MNSLSLNLVMSFLILSSGSFLFQSSVCSEEISSPIDNNNYFEHDYSTFFGHSISSTLKSFDTCLDADGFIYITGTTTSSIFPTTPGAYSGNQDEEDAFVAKINPTCEEVIFSTYLGGSGYDVGKGICVDDEGYVYVTGFTSSDDFPTTTGAFSRNNSGDYDIFVTKVKPDGSDLVYSTYIGGRSYDWAENIDVDVDGSAYIIGRSLYDGYPVTDPSFPKTDGPSYLVVTKFDPTGSSLDYSIKMGSGGVTGYDITVDDKKNSYVTGAVSGRFYTTFDAFDETYNGYYDVFVVKFDQSGQLVFSTFVGGSFDDRGYGIAVDSNEDIYVTGETAQLTMGSYDFPVTTGAFKTYMNSSGDAFVFKMNKSGGSLEYSTYLGGDYSEIGFSIDLDNENNAYITGRVGSDDYHTTYGAYSNNKRGGVWDAFLTKMNVDGSDILYSTFLGGSDKEIGKAVHYKGNNTVLVGGYTESADFPVSEKAYQSDYTYSDNGFVTILNLTTVPHPPRNLTYNSVDAHSLILSWDVPVYDGGSRITGYNIYRSSISGEFERINSTSSENLSISIIDHDPSKGWRYHVRGENAFGESLPSNILVLDDLVRPDFIEDNTPSVGYTGDPLFFNIEAKDNMGLRDVYLEISQIDLIIFNRSMERGPGHEWKHSFIVPHSIEPLSYRFLAYDFRNNLNISRKSMIEIRDNDAPMIEIVDPPSMATTGDEMIVECVLFDHINLESAYLEIRGEGHYDDPIPLTGPESNKWACSYQFPSDNVNELEYSINATDGINFNSTPWRTVQVSDNDPPTSHADRSDPAAFNGRDYHFEIEVIDNIGVIDTWCSIRFDDITGMNITLDHLEDDFYSGKVMIPENIHSFAYAPGAMDREMNVMIGQSVHHDVIDDIKPVILDDLTPDTAYTGDPFEFSVSVDDNIGIEKVSIEYRFGESDTESFAMSLTDHFSAGIIIPANSLDPLKYTIVIDDQTGNRFTSREKLVRVVDNDPPVIEIPDIPSNVGTGEQLVMGLNISDNILPGTLSVRCRLNGYDWLTEDHTLLNESMDSWSVKVPEKIVGNLSVFFIVGDTSGNINSTGPIGIVLVDTISPVIVPVEDLIVKEGESFSVRIIAADNIAISGVKWEGLPSESKGFAWEGSIDDKGTHVVSVTVSDAAGNEDRIIFEITVEGKDDDFFPYGFLILIFIILLLAVIGVIFFLIRKRRKVVTDHII